MGGGWRHEEKNLLLGLHSFSVFARFEVGPGQRVETIGIGGFGHFDGTLGVSLGRLRRHEKHRDRSSTNSLRNRQALWLWRLACPLIASR